jgi:urease accessory protein
VVVHLALAATRRVDLPALVRLDATLDAMKVVREFREASSQMGRQTLRAAVACGDDPLASSYRKAIEGGEGQGHQAVVFGLIGGVLGWNEESAVTAFLYSTSALLCHAAVRLVPLGQRDGQWVLSALAPLVRRLADEAIERREEDLSSFEPALEIRGMRHERVDGRLFRS